MKQFSLKIHGHVQGINFRWNTQKQAKDLGIVGWVRNASDGTVEILAQGSEESLNSLKVWCADGPEFARVEKIEEEWKDIRDKTFDSFEVIY